MTVRSAILSFLLSWPAVSGATVYYLSPSGSDSNNGTSPSSPWRSIDRLMQSIWSVQAGDQILFQRGGTYRGQFIIPNSGTAASNIVVGAYGSGADPVISGSVAVTGWTQYAGNIWRAPLTGQVKYVFVNGQLQTLARYPNSGWLRNDQGSNSSIYDAALTQANGTWTGATVVMRSSNWSYDVRTVSSFTNGTLSFPAINFNLGSYNWGYFLCNKLAQLDQAGEWYHDAAAGQLYLWAPDNANPNTINVEASTRDRGVTVNFNREYVSISGLEFRHQKEAGVLVDGANHVTVSECTFRDLYHGLRVTGTDGVYADNLIERTFASGIQVYGGSNTVSGNQLTDIAMVAGAGESTWGYQGIDAAGLGNIIRENRLTNIGYSGIFVSNNNVLVERNVIRNAVAILNDGGGIHYDNVDALTVQDNIVMDLVGSLESTADESSGYMEHEKMCHGIYFGNVSIRNSMIRRNTAAYCLGSGIHVDHTMVSSGNQVRDNVLFGNEIQLSLSDYSNYNGPGATPPYYVPSFNGVYSGNVLYSLSADQLCMRQFSVYSNTPVDFGSFSNNRYFNPWNELSILLQMIPTGEQRRYTLERWQIVAGEDGGSTRSPLRQDAWSTVSELSGNLVPNGNFDVTVSGWWGWPNNGIVTRDLTYLDNGALKAYLPNGSQYPEYFLRGPDQFNVQNGQWYRMRFSLQSDVHGILKAGLKGMSQLSGGEVVHERLVPFDGGRRDVEFHFQSDMSDQAVVQFVHHYTESRYWVDNVQLHRVTVQPLDPQDGHKLLYNEDAVVQEVALPTGCWSDVNGNVLSGPVTLQPFSSKAIYRVTGPSCGLIPANTVGARVMLGGAMDWGSGLMRTDLLAQGLIPSNQPYTALGISVSNNGQLIAPSVLAATGPDAIVDWVVLELRQNNSSYTVLERRAALLKANGQVVTNDGSAQIPFSSTTQGRYLVVRHRNHLSVMTAAPLSANGQVVDFSSPATALYGFEPVLEQGGLLALWPGDANTDGSVRYTGSMNDRDLLLVAIGQTPVTATETGYMEGDVNLDGQIKYVGAANDRDQLLITIGGSVPTAVRLAQVP